MAPAPTKKHGSRGAMMPFSREDVCAIRNRLSGRDLAIFEVAVSTMLRTSDLLSLRVRDVTDTRGNVVTSFTIRQQKTGNPVTVTLSSHARSALEGLLQSSQKATDAYLFTREDRASDGANAPMSTVALRAKVKRWADLAGHRDVARFSGHSLRRTRAADLYRTTGDAESVRQLLGHASLAATHHYLAVKNEEALALALTDEM